MTDAERNLHAIASTFAGLPASHAPIAVTVGPCHACNGSGRIDMMLEQDRRCSMCGGGGRVASDGGEV